MSVKIVFLDRDGVINQSPKEYYVHNWSQFHFIDRSIEAIKMLKEKGFKLFVISNQAGVSKGMYAKEDLDNINKEMLKTIKAKGGNLDGIFYCTHQDKDECNCRKPKAGLLEMATEGINREDIQCSFFIGDSFRDLEAAKVFGAKGILVLSGKATKDKKTWDFEPEYVFSDLYEAAEYICKNF